MNYKIISFDMFQTLVDVNKRIPFIWKSILRNDYNESKSISGAESIISSYAPVYQEAISSEKFIDMETVYDRCAEVALKKCGFNSDAKKAAYFLMYQHSYAPFYEDVLECLKRIGSRYTVIISSDSNHLMIDKIISKIQCDKVYISDDLQSYKEDSKGRFFDEVLTDLSIKPSEILHIGDSKADIIGAAKAGISNCWLNRNQCTWTNDIKPDHTITNLYDLVSLLK